MHNLCSICYSLNSKTVIRTGSSSSTSKPGTVGSATPTYQKSLGTLSKTAHELLSNNNGEARLDLLLASSETLDPSWRPSLSARNLEGRCNKQASSHYHDHLLLVLLTLQRHGPLLPAETTLKRPLGHICACLDITSGSTTRICVQFSLSSSASSASSNTPQF